MLLSVWIRRFYPLIPIYGENGAGRKNMALLQVEAVSVVKIAKMQDTKFDLNFGVECSIIGYYGGGCRKWIRRIYRELSGIGYKSAELAAKIGMAESSLSRFLSEKTDKIGDEYIIKIADFLGVSTDFILSQTDFPERRNYDIEELGLSYKAAMALYTREVDTDVVSRILESPQFPEITRMIARYF